MYGVSRVDPALNRSPSQQVDHKHAQYLLTDRFSPPQLRLGLRLRKRIPMLPREEGTTSLKGLQATGNVATWGWDWNPPCPRT